MSDNVFVKSRNYQTDKYFSYLQNIVQLFLKDVYNITDQYSSDDTLSTISKLLFKQLASKLLNDLIECEDYRNGIELSCYEYQILTEIVKFYDEIRHPSLSNLKDSDYQKILDKILI